jgi:hypothetical protein
MKKLTPFLILFLISILGCGKNNNSTAPNNPPPPSPPPAPPPAKTSVDSAFVMNDYDAVYTHNGLPVFTFAYHVRNILFYRKGVYKWETYLYNARDTFYDVYAEPDSTVAQKKGCFALVSSIDPSQQGNYNYYIGSYYKFSLFSDTAVGNLQFMLPAKAFPSIDSIRLDSLYYFAAGLNSFYAGILNSEVKVLPDFSDFVRSGDNFSYSNSQIAAQGMIDSAEVTLYVTRFSDNGIHPSISITKTMDANYSLKFYFHDGSYFDLINGKFSNLFFRKTSL